MIRVFLLLIAILAMPSTLLAESSSSEKNIKDSCYILHIEKDKENKKDPHATCARGENGPLCSWPGELSLDINGNGGSFRLFIRQDNHYKVFLPGDRKLWPQAIHISSPSSDLATAEIIVREENVIIEARVHASAEGDLPPVYRTQRGAVSVNYRHPRLGHLRTGDEQEKLIELQRDRLK